MNQTRSGDTKSLDYASLCNQTKRRRICAKQFRPTAFTFSSQASSWADSWAQRLLGNHLLSNQFSGRCFASFVTDRHQKLQTRWKDREFKSGFYSSRNKETCFFFHKQISPGVVSVCRLYPRWHSWMQRSEVGTRPSHVLKVIRVLF